MSISSSCDTWMRRPSIFKSWFWVRSLISATISTACAWWPIMPCMNFTSAAVWPTFERSVACSVLMVLLAWPGAPGCTIRVPVEEPPLAVLHAPTPTAIADISTKRAKTGMYTRQEYPDSALARGGRTRRGCKLPGRFLDAERPVDIGRFHEEIVGARAFIVLGRPTAHPFRVGDDADCAAADGAAQRQLERAGAGRRFVGCLPVDAEAPG